MAERKGFLDRIQDSVERFMDEGRKQELRKAMAEKRLMKRQKGLAASVCAWGAILLLGAYLMWDGYVSEFIYIGFVGLILFLVGLIIILVINYRVKKWDKYESYINPYGNTSLDVIARGMKKGVPQVITDIQEMISNNFFMGPDCDIDAYIDRELGYLVMTRKGKPIKPLEDIIKREKERQEAKSDGEYVKQIRKAIEICQDEEAKDLLYDLQSSVKRLERILDRRPEAANTSAGKKLQSYYLPETIKLVNILVNEDATTRMLEEIKRTLRTCIEAFENLEDQLYENKDLSTEVDIEVLRKTLQTEGFLGNDFDISK